MGGIVEPYVCRVCNKWHVGNSVRARRYADRTLWKEIGDRAYYNLLAENTKTSSTRIRRIGDRCRRMVESYAQN